MRCVSMRLESASERSRLSQSGCNQLQRLRRGKEQARAADRKVEFLRLRLFDTTAQIREMADVALQLDLLLFNMVLLHQRERIVAAMGAGHVEVGEVFQI